MAELISEPLIPHAETHGTRSMAIGEPGLPAGFDWRDRSYRIEAVVRAWKHSTREGAGAGGELYLRRHYYELRMDDGSIWTVYFLRQPPKSGSAKTRWFLYTIDNPDDSHRG
jgi:hypothetical protein